MDILGWALLLMLVGLGLAVSEIFIPSHGIIAFLAGCSIVASIWLAFQADSWHGVGFLGAAVISVPLVIGFALQVWPRTPFGKRVLLAPPSEEEVSPDNQTRRMLRDLVGKIGQAKSLMLPSGAVKIEGQTVDALSEGMAIEAGQWVQVVEVRGTRVIVRPTAAPIAGAQSAPKTNEPPPPEFDDFGDAPFA